ncbi:MAG: hypothetical protein H0X38_11625 [Planctomycetes bacterium]|nr:hypothetical protein [Planctomycetota bacterium]
MQHLRTYDTLAKAEIDRGLLSANGVEAALDGSDSATLGDALRREVRLLVREDQHALALTILADESVGPAGDVQVHRGTMTDLERFAVVLIRTMGMFMMVGGLIYITYIGENMTRIAGERIELVNPTRVKVIWEIVRLAFDLVVGGVMIGYAESLARCVCWGIDRGRRPAG